MTKQEFEFNKKDIYTYAEGKAQNKFFEGRGKSQDRKSVV